MKRFQIYLLFFLLAQHTNSMSLENDPKSKSFYGYYVLCKEICKAYAYSFFLDEVKLEQAKISCCQCQKASTSGYLWGYCASAGSQSTIKKLVPLMYSGSIEELTSFLLAAYTEFSIPCPNCQCYRGWYIIEE